MCRHSCGDGILREDVAPEEPGDEACDDGNDEDGDACRNDCRQARCGDGVQRMDLEVQEAGYEACDDGNDVDTDACRSNLARTKLRRWGAASRPACRRCRL